MNHTRHITSAAHGALGVLLCLGCGDPLKQAQLIEEARVLGVRIEGENGSSQATPGESMEVALLLAGPSGPVDAEVAFRVCVGEASDRGVPHCSEAPFFEGTALASDFPLSAELPADVSEGARLIVLGVACVNSEPRLSADPLDWGCGGDEAPLRFSFETTVASESMQNKNPDLSQVTVELSGTSLPLDSVAATPSCDEEAPSAPADETHNLVVHLGAAAFEEGEQLQVSLFSTEGHLDRQFAFVEQEQTSFSVEFEAGAAEKAVKQYLVVRDSRGGVSWVSWSLCQR